MRVLLVYPNVPKHNWIQNGLACLSAVLKENGHDVRLIDTTWDKDMGQIVKDAKHFKPDLIAFSVRNFEMNWALEISGALKDVIDVPNIFGGPYPTLLPEDAIENEEVDMICRGEGEYVLLELAEKMEKGEDISKIKNIWLKQNGKVIKNPLRPLLEDLDKLPFPDLSIFDRRHVELDYPGTSFLLGRGCPYQCTYCVNPSLQSCYAGLGKFVRHKSNRRMIDEMKDVISSYNVKRVFMADDTFNLSKKRIIDFCKIYKEEIKIPFGVQLRPDIVEREMFEALKTAGCNEVGIAVESGNSYIRHEILNRRMSDKDIIRAFKLAKSVGLNTYAYVMLGLPFETKETIFETIKIIKTIDPTRIHAPMFFPFEGTKIRELCEDNGFITSDKNVGTYYEESILNMPQMSEKDILSFYHTFKLYLKVRREKWPIVDLVRAYYRIFPKKLFHALGNEMIERVFKNINSTKTLLKLEEGEVAYNKSLETVKAVS